MKPSYLTRTWLRVCAALLFSLASASSFADQIDITYAPDRVAADGVHNLAIDYQADADRDLVVAFFDANWNYFGQKIVQVAAGSDSIEVAFSPENNPSIGDGYRFKADLRLVGDSWENATVQTLAENVSVVSDIYNWVGILEKPSELNASEQVTLTVAYAANQASTLSLDFFSSGYTYITGTTVDVAKGSGSVELTLSFDSVLAAASDYIVKTDLRPAGGDWTTAIVSDEINPLAVVSPFTDAVSFNNPPAELQPGTSYTLSIDYEAPADRTLVLDLFTETWAYLAGTSTNVSQGQGNADLTVETPDVLTDGTYRFKAYTVAPGGTWEDALVEAVIEVQIETPLVDAIAIIDAPAIVDAQTSYSLDIAYDAEADRTIAIEMFDSEWNWLGQATKNVTRGSGSASLTLELANVPAAGTNYRWKAMMYPLGGNYETATAQQIINEVTVNAVVEWDYALNGPAPGSVYKEYYRWNGDNNEWRVTDPTPGANGAYDFLPNPILDLNIDDLDKAVRAELIIDHWGGHPLTNDRKIIINGVQDELEAPLPETLPEDQAADHDQFFFQFSPVMEIPLWKLQEGINTFQGSAETRDPVAWNWGQWGWYSLKVRVYYDASKPHATAEVLSPVNGGDLAENADKESLITFGNASSDAVEIETYGIYRDIDTNGSGYYENLHFTQFAGYGNGSMGTSAPNGTLAWNTEWVPDQTKPIKVLPRVKSSNGTYYVLPITEMNLKRTDRSVKMYTSYGLSPWYGPTYIAATQTYVNRSNSFDVPATHPVADAARVNMFVRTWHGADYNNNPRVKINSGEWRYGPLGYDHYPAQGFYDFADDQISLINGENTVYFESTWTDTSQHHTLEILWPGPMFLAEYPYAVAD